MKAEVDSRDVEPGDAFYALKGEKTDGHRFLADVAKAGARVAYVSESYQGPNFGLQLVHVPDVLEQLMNDAKQAFQRLSQPLIAVTGSVGKTTTKDFLATLLRRRWPVLASYRSQNGQIGLPLSIMRARGDEKLLVLEMAMSEKGQIQRLVQLAPPTISMITTVTHVHARGFTSLRDIALAKGEIFSHPQTKIGLIGYETPYRSELENLGNCAKITFSARERAADYFCKRRLNQLEVFEHGKLLFATPWHLRGDHSLHNFVGAVAAARLCGLEVGDMLASVPRLALPPLRGQLLERKGVTFVMDCYNACAASISAALTALPRPAPGARAIAFLGDMKELGAFSEEAHREAARSALMYVDELVCFGDEAAPMKVVWDDAGRLGHHFATKGEALERLKSVAEKGDVVLVKGARVHCLETVIDSF